jgi:ABC-type sugar transport system ATPase subunit
LSGGNQQKVVLAKWLATRPRILLLEEPTRGVDVGAKHEIYELLRGLAAEGMAIVLISTEMPELLGLCDRVIVLHRGEVTGVFAQEDATPERILAAAMGANTADEN